MKLSSIAILMLLNIATLSCFGMQVTIPSASILKQKLNELDLADFSEKTDIVDRLGGKELGARTVVFIVESAIKDYLLRSPRVNIFKMEMARPVLMEMILENSPEAVKEYKKNGLL